MAECFDLARRAAVVTGAAAHRVTGQVLRVAGGMVM